MSVAGFSGVMTGLLQAMGDGASADEGLARLFGDFDILSSCSGGTWFAQELQYSPQFVSLLGKMAQEPGSAGEIFNADWMAKRLDRKGANLKDLARKVATCSKSLKPKTGSSFGLAPEPAMNASQLLGSIAQDLPPQLKAVLLLLETALFDGPGPLASWSSYIELMYAQTSGLTKSQGLGGKANPWAQGKLGVWNAALPSPRASGNTVSRAYDNEGPSLSYDPLDHYPVWEGKTGAPGAGDYAGVRYALRSTQDASLGGWWPFLLPVKFSAYIGSANDDAPLPFCAYKECFGLYLEYQGRQGANGTTLKAHSRNLSDIFRTAYTADAFAVPVGPVGAASSAAESFQTATKDGEHLRLAHFSGCATLAVWAGGDSAGRAFDQGSKLLRDVSEAPSISQALLDELAAGGLHALSDGGPTDITAVAQAVAAAHSRDPSAQHTTVVAFDFNNNYQGDADTHSSYETLSSQFLNYNDDEHRPWEWDNDLSIFASPRRRKDQKIVECSPTQGDPCMNWTTRLTPTAKTTCLKEVRIGKIQEATTVENNWFGILGGKKVIYHLIRVDLSEDSDKCPWQYTIGTFKANWDLYGIIVQELVDVMQDNKDKVSEIMKLFLAED